MNSNFSTTTGTTAAYQTVNGSCDTGYYAKGTGVVSAVCETNGTWSFNNNIACGKDCQNNAISTSLYSGFATTGTTVFGNTLYGSCIGQYIQVQAACQTSGIWSYTVGGVVGGSCPIVCENSALNSNNVNFIFSAQLVIQVQELQNGLQDVQLDIV